MYNQRMTQTEMQAAAKAFAKRWQGHGYEKGESQKFYIDLLSNVFGVKDFAGFIYFENQIKERFADKTITNFIDAYIPSTKVMIEQKSSGKDLHEPIRQSDGTFLTPFQQARKYIAGLPLSEHPRWVVTGNFETFLVYDMEQPNGEPEEIRLENLEKDYYRLSFLTDTGSVHLKKELEISKKAGDIISEIYDAILKQYKDADSPSPATLKSLNMLCVRIVFCLYAEDAGIFGYKSIFGDYVKSFEAKDLRRALLDLFQVLDQKPDERDPYLEENLAQFPYVNGGLFTEKDKTIPPLTEEIKELLVHHASSEFDWSEISPTIFGAIFESTLNPETRRSGGMHYTSIENIHKVIDPLFMDSLNAEFIQIKQIKQTKTRIEKAKLFHKKLGMLQFLDPACGSGNFLTEAYLSLRRLGNECIKIELGIGQDELSLAYKAEDLIQVSIRQFYGIEINDFAAVVAKTALWIAESQMMKETSKIIDKELDFLPLKSYTNIVEGNALHLDWNATGEASRLPDFDPSSTPPRPNSVRRIKYNYIMGNPPFVGARLMSEEQKKDVNDIWRKTKNVGNLDYVSCWYKKAADLIKGTNTKAALVSTNSITQGEQPAILWKTLMECRIKIDFAYRTFRWDSESNLKAHVHCVIIGFSCRIYSAAAPKSSAVETVEAKRIYINEKQSIEAKNINGYLLDAPDIFIESRSKPLCNVPEIGIGNKPIDGGNYLFTEEEKNAFIKKEPAAEKYFRKWLGSDEFINCYFRYCLWLGECSPAELRKMPECMKRAQAVRDFRLASKSVPTQKLADTPTRFHVENMPENTYLLIPRVSSEKRRYIPIGYIEPPTLSSDSVHIIPDATLYDFGVLTSSVHMAWMRAVCGRLEMRYRYSKDIVYNNFPWPGSVDSGQLSVASDCESGRKQQIRPVTDHYSLITKTAQEILDARAKYPDCSLADLYDELTMPAELRKAHQANDRAVMAAYGFSPKMTESEVVAELFKMYESLVANL